MLSRHRVKSGEEVMFYKWGWRRCRVEGVSLDSLRLLLKDVTNEKMYTVPADEVYKLGKEIE